MSYVRRFVVPVVSLLSLVLLAGSLARAGSTAGVSSGPAAQGTAVPTAGDAQPGNQTAVATDPTAQPPTNPQRATPAPTLAPRSTPNRTPSAWGVPTQEPITGAPEATALTREEHEPSQSEEDHAAPDPEGEGESNIPAILSGAALLLGTALGGILLLRRN